MHAKAGGRSMSNIIELSQIEKEYKIANKPYKVLKGINLEINEGEFALILGPSGSGKTTLLNLIGGIDLPTSGSVLINGRDITKLSNKELSHYRAQVVGWVFQFFNLVPSLTALENVCLGLELAKLRDDMEAKSTSILQVLGLGDYLDRFPSELSGGQQQRVAMARALVKNPAVIIADEPTGNLDSKTSIQVIKTMQALNRDKGVTFVVVSHDESLKDAADHIFHLRDGQIFKEVNGK